MTLDPEHKFELALHLADLKVAYQLAKEAQVSMGYRGNTNTLMYKSKEMVTPRFPLIPE